MLKRVKNSYQPGQYVEVSKDARGLSIYPSVRGLIVAKNNGLYRLQTGVDTVCDLPFSWTTIISNGKPDIIDNFISKFQSHIRQIYNGHLSDLSRDWLRGQIMTIKKNIFVLDCFVNKNEELIILTKNLPIFSLSNHRTRRTVGRMVIKLDPTHEILIKNLDWKYTHNNLPMGATPHEHPHVSESGGHVCWGDPANGLLDDCLSRADLYGVLEIAIEMLTQFDLDEEEYTEWLTYRKPHTDHYSDFIAKARRTQEKSLLQHVWRGESTQQYALAMQQCIDRIIPTPRILDIYGE